MRNVIEIVWLAFSTYLNFETEMMTNQNQRLVRVRVRDQNDHNLLGHRRILWAPHSSIYY